MFGPLALTLQRVALVSCAGLGRGKPGEDDRQDRYKPPGAKLASTYMLLPFLPFRALLDDALLVALRWIINLSHQLG